MHRPRFPADAVTVTENAGRGWSPPNCEVQLGKRTGGRRGAPFGNGNRLKHGRYAAETIAVRKETEALLRPARALIRRALLFAKLRKILSGKARHLAAQAR